VPAILGSKKGLYEGRRAAYGGSRLKGALRRVCQARENIKIRFKLLAFRMKPKKFHAVLKKDRLQTQPPAIC
jgi:hypothetical protein